MLNMVPYRSNRNVAPRGFFDDFTSDFFKPLLDGFGMIRPDQAMKVDVKDEGDRYTLEADMPGVSKDNLKVEVANGTLTISADYDEKKEEKGEDDKYVYRERRCGSMRRSFNVEGIREDDITAEFKDGVLKLTLPKQEVKAIPEARAIEIQ
jgi:HSP20 family protein